MKGKKKQKVTLTSWAVVLVVGVMLLVNTALGAVLVNRSRNEMLEMIHDRMLDVAKVAAAQLDGDELAALTAEDRDTTAYQTVLKELAVFQDNIDLDYIYIIRPMPDGTFTFGPDPAMDPGEFGEAVVSTPALVRAAEEGVSTVDEEPYTDRWGRFYSAYTPVMTSSGKVGGILAVDFPADWLEREVNESVRIVLIGSVITTVLAFAVVIGISTIVQKKMQTVNHELDMLSESVGDLSRELSIHTVITDRSEEEPDESTDEIGSLTHQLRILRNRLKHYVAHMQVQATQDRMTGVNNRTQYAALVKKLDAGIRVGTGVFTLVIFDVDKLKEVNDRYGHDVGDQLLVDAADLISHAFGKECVYRIGGDEFIAVLEGHRGADANMRMQNMERLLSDFNEGERAYECELAVSMGMATYRPGEDMEYRDVFRRADEAMYAEKEKHHRGRIKEMGQQKA